jgi:hypothetical protein
MKISYISNTTNSASDGKSFNTEFHVGKTLEKLGHEVEFIQENTILGGTLPELVKDSQLFLWTRTWPDVVTLDDLRAIEALGIPTVSFHLDKYAGIARDGGIGIGSPFWHTQYVFSPEGSIQSQRIFKEHGINQYYSPPAVFEDECYIAEPVEKFKHEIVFVGGGGRELDGTLMYHPKDWPYRMKLIDWLRETYGDRFVKYGYPQETIRGAELNQLYAGSKIVIGDSLCKDFIDNHYTSDRPFEVTGRGGMIIMPYIPGMTDFFVDRKEAVFYAYDNFVQLKNLIDYYLEPANEAERENIRMAGHLRTKAENTYTQRMEKMLDTLKAEGAIHD